MLFNNGTYTDPNNGVMYFVVNTPIRPRARRTPASNGPINKVEIELKPRKHRNNSAQVQEKRATVRSTLSSQVAKVAHAMAHVLVAEYEAQHGMEKGIYRKVLKDAFAQAWAAYIGGKLPFKPVDNDAAINQRAYRRRLSQASSVKIELNQGLIDAALKYLEEKSEGKSTVTKPEATKSKATKSKATTKAKAKATASKTDVAKTDVATKAPKAKASKGVAIKAPAPKKKIHSLTLLTIEDRDENDIKREARTLIPQRLKGKHVR